MQKTLIPFHQVKQLSATDLAYISGDPRLQGFYQYEPSLDSFKEILLNKERGTYPRADLVQALTAQYTKLNTTEAVQENIEALLHENTFTIVTAHQPSLFLGPLYFLYKALTTIVLAEAVQDMTGGRRRIVPVFVLGSEDHDLAELNSINLYGKKITWPSEETGAVGSMSTESLAPVLAELKTILGDSPAAQSLFQIVHSAYADQATIADATRAILNYLFGAYGLLVLDMNQPLLKRHFAPIIKAELTEMPSVSIVNSTAAQLNALGFKTQATPRDINLFYLKKGLRERIVLENGTYKVLNTNIEFTKEEILSEVDAHPENFSPNVVLRPVYQELVLPNLAYVGGGGELAYWLERRDLFRHFGVQFPMLVRRHSVLWLDQDVQKKLAKLGFSPAEFFEDTEVLVRQYVEKNASTEISLSPEIESLKDVFERLAQKASATDPTLENAVRADAVKAVAALEQWEGRLRRTEKQKHEVSINQLRALKEKLFPANGLQERYDNFIPYLLKNGDSFIHTLKEGFAPFDKGFLIFQ